MTDYTFETMNHIDPALVEEIDLTPRKKRRMPARPRAGLIAACLCLALVGTAFAAAPELITGIFSPTTVKVGIMDDDPNIYQTIDEDGNKVYSSGFMVTGDVMTSYPLSAFSEELREASDNRGDLAVVQRSFDTWEEVQAFLGEDIPLVWPRVEDCDQPIWVSLFHTGHEVLWGVNIYSSNYSSCHAIINIDLRTELGREIAGTAGVYTDEDVTQLDSYLMANGGQAEIVLVTAPEEQYHDAKCYGIFMRDGIVYQVTVHGLREDPEEMVQRLQALLDSFSHAL